MQLTKSIFLVFLGALMLAPASHAQQTNYWDLGGTTNFWFQTANWNTAPDGSGGDPTITTGSTVFAYFNITPSNGAVTVRLDNPVNVQGLIFNSAGAVSLLTTGANRTITLGSGGITINSGAGTVVFGSTTANFRIPFTLSAAQTWQNNSTNVLSLNANNTIATAGFMLNIDGTGDIVFGGAVSGTGGLIKNGAGALTLSAVNTYTTGGTILSNGQVNVNANKAFGATAANLSINGPVTLDNTTAGLVTLASNAVAWNADFTFVGTSDLDFGNGAVTLNNNRQATVNGGNLFIGGVIGDGGASYNLIKQGAGILTLSGANTYGGNTYISNGVLAIRSTGALPGWNVAGRYAVNGGAALAVANSVTDADIATILGTGNLLAGAGIGFDTTSGNRAYTNVISDILGGASPTYKIGSNTLTLAGVNTYSGGTFIRGGTLNVSNDTALGAAGGTLTMGGTSIGGATLWTSGDMTLNNRAVKLDGAGTFNTDAGTTLTITNVISGPGALYKDGAGILTVNNDIIITGLMNVNAGTLNVSGTSTNLANINLGNAAGARAVLNIQGGTLITAILKAGNAAGSTGIIYQTGGTVGPNGTSVQVGGTAGSYGEYHFYGGSLNAGPNLYVGVNGNTIGLFEMTNGTMTATTLVVGRNNTAGATNITAYYYQSGGTATVTTLNLGGGGGNATNVYGLLAISNGTFSATTFSSFASGGGNNTSQVYLGKGALVTLGAFPSARGGNSYADITFDGGQLSPSAASANYMTNLNHAYITTNGAIFNVTLGKDITIAQPFENATGHNGKLTKTGDGALVLTGTNTYTGGTTVNGGVLTVLNTNALPQYNTPGQLSVSSNAAIGIRIGGAGEWNDYAVILDMVTNANMSAGSLLGFDTTSSSVTISNNLTDLSVSIGYAKLGANTLTLTGTNTYTGPTWIYGGTLSVDAISDTETNVGIGFGNLLRFNNTGTLQVTGSGEYSTMRQMESLGTLAVFDITNAAAKLVLSGNMSGAGGLTKSGLGAMVLSNNVVTIGGTLSVQQGNLVFDNAYVTNTANVIDSIGNTPGNTATLTLQGSSLYYRTANALQLGSNATSKGVMVIMNNATYIGNAGLNVGLNGTGLVYMSGGVLNNNGTISIGSTGVGAVGAFYQTGGLINNMSGQQFYISRHDSGYGFYQMSGGTLTNNGYIQVGSDGVGLLYQDGGNISVLANGILVGNNGGTGVLYQTGGTIYSTPSTTIGWNGVAGSFGQYTIAGTATSVFASVILNRSAGVAGGIAIFNLNGNALLQAGSVQKGNTNTLAIVNFNGATLLAGANSATFLQGLSYANVYGGGVTIDSSTNNITIAQNLLTPAGQGITNITWTAGSLGGYIGAPFVSITGGGGTGATAVALFDYTSGTVTGVVITSAGFGYTGAPTITLMGGGNTNYVVGTADIGSNTSGGLTKLGVGLLTLTGTNTYGGVTDIRAGLLSIAGTYSLPGWDTTGRYAVSNGAALAVGNAVSDADIDTILNTGNFAGGTGLGFDTTAGDRTYGNVISNTANGTLGLIKLGANTLILPGANTYSGGTLVISGLLTVANSAALGSGAATVLNGAGLALSNSICLPNDITIAGTGPSANGALHSIDGVNTNGGLITLSAPSSIQTYSGSTLYLTNVINNGGYTLTIVSSGDTIISGPITNSGALVKNNAGRLTLSGANTYSGNTTINNGTLTYGVDNAINSPSNVTVNANSAGATAVLDLNGYNGTVAGLTMGGSGGTASSVNKVLTGAGVLTLGGNVTVVATGNPTNLALISGKLDLGGADRIFSVADSTTAAVDLDLQAAITGSGVGFTKTGAGTMQLSASNTFTGVLTLNAGTLRATSSVGALGAGTVQLNGGTLYLANDAGLAFNRAVTVSSNTTITADNITSSGNSRTFTFTTLSINQATLTVTRGGNITGIGDGVITFSGLTTLTSNATFSVSTDGNRVLNLNGGVTNVGGAYGFTKSGGGLLVLAGAGTFAGDVTLNGGTLRGTVANAFGTGRIVSIAGSTLDLRNANAATNRDVDVTTAGTLTLLLAVNSATKFNLNSIDVDPSLALTISVNRSSGTNTNITHTLNTVISTLGAATLNVTGGNGYSLILDGPGNLNIGGALNFNATTADVEIKDPITDGAGSYGVTFGQGIANMKLSAVNLYNGNTVITKTNGLLQLGVADAIPYGSGNGNFSMSPVQGMATFDLNGFNQTLNGFSSSGAGNSIVTNSAATAVTLTIGDNDQGGSFAGSIGDNPSGTLSLTKTGAGLIALDGTNTFIGPTLINAGTLSINGALLNSPVTANSGGTLGGTGFVNNLTIDGGALSPGNSAGTLVVGDLTLTNNPTLVFDLGPISDLVIVTNTLTFANMETNWFFFSDAGIVPNTTYTLFQATNLNGSLGAGTHFTGIAGTSYDGDLYIDGNNVQLIVVPEPGSATLVAAGLALMLLLRRRR